MNRRRVVVTLAAILVPAAAVIALVVLLGRHQLPSAARTTCPSPGCSVVSLSRTLPPSTVFYGASCSGVRGAWFLNAVEGGGNDQLRPSYSLRWRFSPGQAVALPSGRIVMNSTDSARATLTLERGTMTLQGSRGSGMTVSAAGTLTVQVSGTPTSPTLTFTETGLSDAEAAIGLVSPFDVGGEPLTVPIRTSERQAGC